VIATRPERVLSLAAGHVSAASGLVVRDDEFFVVADDEHHLGVFARGGAPGRLHRLLPGELPAGKRERKARKPDFEILLALPDRRLLAMGSGSRPTRERAVLVGADLEPVRTVDTAPLCARLRTLLPELNLEGAALCGDEWVLVQRGSGVDPRNALLFLPRAQLEDGLARGTLEAATPRVVGFELGEVGGVRWSVTDAAFDDGDFWFTAVLEDTRDAYADGACHGSALARVTPAGQVRRLERLDTDAKVEGLAFEGDTVWMVTDADDPDIPARLLTAQRLR